MLNAKAKSRGRVAIGALATMLLAGTALAATASGSRAGTAIEQASERVVTALAVPPVPPAPPIPAAPAAPIAPQAAETPPAPPAPPAPPEWTDADGDGPRKIVKRKMKIIRDGKEIAWNEDDMPNIDARDCGDGEGDGKTHVLNRTDGKKKITIICTNRIEKAAETAALASVDVEKITRDAMRNAMAGLVSARASIASAEMNAEDRAQALAGIDQAQREMEEELRKGE